MSKVPRKGIVYYEDGDDETNDAADHASVTRNQSAPMPLPGSS